MEDGNPGVSVTQNRPFEAEATDYQVLKMPRPHLSHTRTRGTGQEEEAQQEDGRYTAKMWGSLISWGFQVLPFFCPQHSRTPPRLG